MEYQTERRSQRDREVVINRTWSVEKIGQFCLTDLDSSVKNRGKKCTDAVCKKKAEICV
jgi:hypothetical protein